MNNKEILIKRLQYQSWHRGCKETDIILGNFAKSELTTLNMEALLDFDQLLHLNDSDIYNWFAGLSELQHQFSTDILQKIKEFHKQQCQKLN